MVQKSFDEKILEIEKKQAQLDGQKKSLKKKQSVDERKKRTRRLIELGGIVESVLGRATTDDDKIRLMNFLKSRKAMEDFSRKQWMKA